MRGMHIQEANCDAPAGVAARQRSVGRIRLVVGPSGEGGPTRIRDLAESGPSRLRFPRVGGAPEAVLVNTAGGIACGDDFRVELDLAAGANSSSPRRRRRRSTARMGRRAASRTTSRSERGRGSLGCHRRRSCSIRPACAAASKSISRRGPGCSPSRSWPSAARRGRSGSGGLFADAWRVRRDGRLTYADTALIQGPISDLLAPPDRRVARAQRRPCSTSTPARRLAWRRRAPNWNASTGQRTVSRPPPAPGTGISPYGCSVRR